MANEETIKLHKDRIDELKERIRLKNCDIQEILEDVWERLDGPHSFDNDPDVVVEAGRIIAKYQQYIKNAYNEIVDLEKCIENTEHMDASKFD